MIPTMKTSSYRRFHVIPALGSLLTLLASANPATASPTSGEPRRPATPVPALAESDVVVIGDIVVTPDPVLAGQEIVVRYKIKNQGTLATSGSFTSRLQLKNQYEFTFSTTDYIIPALAAGQVSSQEHHLTLDKTLFSGVYSARLRLDPFLELANEADNGNDASDPFPFTVIAVLPDIKVTFAEVCPHSAHAGDAVQLKFRILNDSSSPAPAARNRIELTNPRSNQPVFSVYQNSGIIPPHGTVDYVFPFTIPADGVVGKWNVSVFLNDFSDYPEADTFNNVTDPLVQLQVVAAGTATEPCVEPIQLANPRFVNGKLTLDVQGAGNATYTVQGSTDLKTWTTASPVTLVNGRATWTAPAGSATFFRLIR